MGFLVGAALGDAVRKVVAAGPCDMAVAYWGTKAEKVLGLPDDLRGYRIACDAFSGSCAPATIKALMDRGAAVYDMPRLHAKVYHSEASMVVASANASIRGFDSRAPGLEAGVFNDNPADLQAAKAWFEEILPFGRKLDVEDIPRLELVWNPYGAGPRFSRPIAAALNKADPDLGALDLWVYVYREAGFDLPEEALYKASDYYDEAAYQGMTYYPFFWREWPQAEVVGKSFLCFTVDAGEVRCERIWKVLDELRKGDLVVWPAREDPRFQLGRAGQVRALEANLDSALQRSLIVADTPPMLVHAFAAILALAKTPWAKEAHSRMQLQAVREAYAATLAWGAGRKLTFDPQGKDEDDKISMKLLGGEHRRMFSFIVNRTHLLFYLLKPTLERWPSLLEVLGANLKASPNKSGEIKVRLETAADVAALVNWMEGRLPAVL